MIGEQIDQKMEKIIKTLNEIGVENKKFVNIIKGENKKFLKLTMLTNKDIINIIKNSDKIESILSENNFRKIQQLNLFNDLILLFYFLNQSSEFYSKVNLNILGNLIDEIKLIITSYFYNEHLSTYFHYIFRHIINYIITLKKKNLDLLAINNQNFEKSFQNLENIVQNCIPKNFKIFNQINEKEKLYFKKKESLIPNILKNEKFEIKDLSNINEEQKYCQNILLVNLENLILLNEKGIHLKYYYCKNNFKKKNNNNFENYNFIKTKFNDKINVLSKKIYNEPYDDRPIAKQIGDLNIKIKNIPDGIEKQIYYLCEEEFIKFKKKMKNTIDEKSFLELFSKKEFLINNQTITKSTHYSDRTIEYNEFEKLKK